jgi:hypothetical protein
VPREGSRCQALNRPLARFCRYCQEAFPDGWFAAALAAEVGASLGAGPGAGEPPALQLGPPEPVLCLSDRLDRQEAPLELREVSGRVWVGTSTGRFLMVEPFRTQPGETLLRRPWPTTGRVHLRSQAAGVWLVLWCELGLQALDLLPFDGPVGQDFRFLPIWKAGPDERVVTDPALLRLPEDSDNPASGLDRAVVWLTAGADGLALWTALLSINAARQPTPRRYPLKEVENAEQLGKVGPGELTLIPAPLKRRDLALLRSRRALCWVSLGTGDAADPVGKPRLLPVMGPPSDGRGFLFGTGRTGLPGLFFVPSATPDEAPAASRHLGQVFVAAQRDGEGERHDLYAISCGRSPGQSSFTRLGEGIPFALTGAAGACEVLCLTATGLRRYNELGMTTLHYDNPLLRGAQRGQATERLVACSGIDASTGQPRWFTTLIDQRAGRLINQLASKEILPAPILLGHHLIAVERIATGPAANTTPLYLARRPLLPVAAAG